MNEQYKKYREEVLSLIKELEVSPLTTQRNLAVKLNISLGKTNYLLQELIKKGTVKAKNFSHNKGKFKKVKYILTKKGLEEKLDLTCHFLKRKEEEYTCLKKDWEKLNETLKGSNNKNSEDVFQQELVGENL